MVAQNSEAPSAGAPKRSGLTGRSVLLAVRRRPLSLFGVALLAAGVGLGVWVYLPVPKHTATTVFHISAQPPVLLTRTSDVLDFGSYRASQVALIKRRLTLSSVLKQPEVQNLETVRQQPDPLGWLDRSLSVQSSNYTEFMRVSLEGNNPEDLRVILVALNKAYLAEVDERDNGVRRRRLAKLEETNRSYRGEMDRFAKRMDTIALALGSKDSETLAIIDSLKRDELRIAIRELSATRDSLQWAERDLAAGGRPNAPNGENAPLEWNFPWGLGRAIQGGDIGGISPAQIDEEMRRDAGLMALEMAVTQARQALSDTRDLFKKGEAPPAVVQAEEKLKAAELKRDKYRNELRPLVADALRKQGALKAQERLFELRAVVDALKKKEEQARAKVVDTQKDISTANEYRAELENIKTTVSQNEKQSRSLLDEAERIKVELGASLTRVTLTEEPFVVAGSEGNRRFKYTLLAALGVTFAGFGAIVLWEHRSRRVTHTDDVTAALGVRLIGSVPPTCRDAAPDHGAQSMLVESVDAARTILLHGAHDRDLRVLVVASAVAGEGKTSLSGHLAISLARAGFRTLLIDGDLRSPTADRLFAVPLSPGLCEYLHGSCDREPIHRTEVPGLSIMTAGAWTLEIRHALVGAGWAAAIERLRAQFDYVVIDTSPLLLVSDTLMMAREADGVVVSVLMGVSQVALVDEAVQRLSTVGAKVVGVIANGVHSAAHGYGYGYGYGEKPRPKQPEALSAATER